MINKNENINQIEQIGKTKSISDVNDIQNHIQSSIWLILLNWLFIIVLSFIDCVLAFWSNVIWVWLWFVMWLPSFIWWLFLICSIVVWVWLLFIMWLSSFKFWVLPICSIGILEQIGNTQSINDGIHFYYFHGSCSSRLIS